jgi:hypothetical protein
VAEHALAKGGSQDLDATTVEADPSAEQAGLVAAAWVVRIERVSEQLGGVDDRPVPVG